MPAGPIATGCISARPIRNGFAYVGLQNFSGIPYTPSGGTNFVTTTPNSFTATWDQFGTWLSGRFLTSDPSVV